MAAAESAGQGGFELSAVSALRFLVVTPARNEEAFIEQTILSMLGQRHRPCQWIIIDDGSTDRTRDIIMEQARVNPFIKPLDRHQQTGTPDEDRLAWAAEARAVNFGLAQVDLQEYDFIVKLDADLAFGSDYFERLFHEFEKNPRLGIAGGHCYYQEDGGLRLEKVPDAHVRGATKIYRGACFTDIGGIEEVLGWDTIDEVRAHMCGWTTRSFREPKLVHLRPTGSVGGLLRGKVRAGAGSYFLCYHPIYMLLRGLRQMKSKPYIIGGLAMVYGFFRGYLTKAPTYQESAVVGYLRREQVGRITRSR